MPRFSGPSRIMLTPALADEFLGEMLKKQDANGGENLPHNRRLRSERVVGFINIIKNGKFVEMPDPIMFGMDGIMGNGQHRCWACSESGISIPMRIEYKCSQAQMDAVDTGAPRDFADMQHYSGAAEGTTNAHGSLAKMMVMGPTGKRSQKPHDVVRGWYEFYKDGINFASKARFNYKIAGNKVWNMALSTVVARAWYSIPEEQLLHFARVLSSGQREFDADLAATTLRDAISGGRLGTTEAEQYFKAEAALQAFIERRPIKKLQQVEKELFKIDPLPKEFQFKESPNIRERLEKAVARMSS